MHPDIELTEYTEASVRDLDSVDVEHLIRELASRIDISRPPQGEGHQLNPRQYVGVAILPSGRRISVRPKVPVANLGYMLATALNLPEFRRETTRFERFDDLLEHVARYFEDLVERCIDHGLYRTYVEQTDNLATIRGRIDLATDMRRNAVLRHRTYCEFTEFTWNVPENQVIRQVTRALAGFSFSSAFRTRLRNIDTAMATVSVAHMHADDIDRFRYHRFNEEYRPIHRLCQVFLEGASLSEELGHFDARTFLVDMNRLFESFVTRLLQEHAITAQSVAAPHRMFLDRERLVQLIPDVVVFQEERATLVADCKYKQRAPDEFRTADVYQLLAYAEALQTPEAMILIPQHEVAIAQSVTVPEVPVRIMQASVDLGVAPHRFAAECSRFADQVLGTVA